MKILVSTTHAKVVTKTSADKEFEKRIINALTVKDTSDRYNPDATRCFYNEERQLFPSAILPHIRMLAKRFGHEVEVEDRRTYIVPNTSFLDNGGHFTKDISLRDYQIDALRSLSESKFGGIIKSPVGTGKSIMIAGICKMYEGTKLIVLPSISLVHQQRDELLRCGFREDEIAVFQGENVVDEGDEHIILLCEDSYVKAAHRFPEVRVVAVDEAHYFSNTMEKIIFSCQSATIRIGISATPLGHDNPAKNMMVTTMYGRMVFDKEIAEMVQKDVLVKMKIKIYHIDDIGEFPVSDSWADKYEFVEITEEEADRLKSFEVEKEDGKFFKKVLVEYGNESIAIVQNEYRNKLIRDIALENKRVLILIYRIEHGEILKEMIGSRAMLVSGKDSISVRKQAIRYLEENEDAIIIASNVFNTGVNIKGIQNVINAVGGKSPILVEQKLGRGTRKSDYFEKTEATTHDFYDHFHPVTKKQSKKRMETYKSLNLPIESKFF